MVGDVKQSIYRFRQAVAELFIGKKTAFSPYDGVHYPAKIILGQNFRSRAGITGGVNFLFEHSGIAPGTAWEDVPEDWVCPVCGLSKDMFTAE